MVGGSTQKNKRKVRQPGFMNRPLRRKENRSIFHAHRIRVRRRKTHDCGRSRKDAEKSMEIRKKFHGVITASMFKVKALLIGCNFSPNSVSNIAGVVEADYTTSTGMSMR